MASFFAAKEDNPLNYLLKLSLLKSVQQVVQTIHRKTTDKLSEVIKKDIDKHVIEIVLENHNTQKVMDLGRKVNVLPLQISRIHEETTTQTSQTLQSIVMPWVLPSTVGKQKSVTILDSNPSLFLLESLINTIFNFSHIDIVEKWMTTKLYGAVQTTELEDVEINKQVCGSTTINVTQTPENYAYDNIQEIAKLGGNEFMLNKVLSYIKNKPTSFAQSQSIIYFVLSLIKDLIQEFSYAGVFISQGISQEQLFYIESELGILRQTLGLNNTGSRATMHDYSQEVTPEEIRSTLKVLKESYQRGAERSFSDTITLSLRDYHLKINSADKDMLHINQLSFEAGNVYAITGKIGTGKTTLLTDVAKCLMPVFCSSGMISYPTYQQKAIEQIFCGSVPFSPPATTLFERLTYRLDQEYVNSHQEELLLKAIGLFKTLGQQGFSKEKLLTKGNNGKLSLSTGQEKLTMVISAILYKLYLEEPVLFVIDETLANLDISTTQLVCTLIKRIFSDSIVLSVDHNAKHNRAFYTEQIDLALYTPEPIEEKEVIGDMDISTAS